MKNLKKLTAILFLCLAVVSCNKDDGDSEPTNAELIIGLFQLQSVTQDGNPFALGPCDLLETVRFNESGAFTQTIYSGENCAVITPLNGTYTITDTSITTNVGSDATIVRIVTLNDSSLSVEFNESGILFVQNYIRK
ncbi:MAG: lipocalin family protein [Patiriisocius sp.]|uniref:lipocalin family protein n=1 Tax=Patiriisocius sp. TaxID=2822396 RepID=UPI003EF10A04